MKTNTENIKRIMSENYQIDISVFDNLFLLKTIEARISELSLRSGSEYLSYLKESTPESVSLRESLNNSYSEFFRPPLTFHMIEHLVLPKLFNRREYEKSGDIRIWSAGCAAGQEPYSLAILTEDYRAANHKENKIRVFGTDRNQKELSTASKGIYHFKSVQNTKLYYISTYFSNSGEFYSINSVIKDIVDFSLFDLLGEDSGSPPSSIYGDFEIVMCSNLLFYYNPEIQKKIVSRLTESLEHEGFLITGEAEVELIKSYSGLKQLSSLVPIFVKT